MQSLSYILVSRLKQVDVIVMGGINVPLQKVYSFVYLCEYQRSQNRLEGWFFDGYWDIRDFSFKKPLGPPQPLGPWTPGPVPTWSVQ